MKQILQGYKDYYFLSLDGKIYNKKDNIYIYPDKEHRFYLRKEDGTGKKVTLKELYRLVFDRNYCLDEIENLDGEEWKPIERTDQMYWISNKGRVKSLKGYKAIILKPNIHHGYERVDIMLEGSRSSKLVSRLVASAFLLPPAALDMQLHHIDGKKTNNSKENLIWLTPKEHREIHNRMNKVRNEEEKNV